jgi:phosphoglucomutase
MKERELYERWMSVELSDPDLTEELKGIKDDDDAIIDRFYKDLEFGTGGLRGVIGAGTNRINIYTVNRATQGLANYLNSIKKGASVAISYDSRIKSDVFARASAGVLAANGVKAYIYKELMPTPLLSYAVRELKTDAGIMVTASHNPSKYNGYKCYGPDGCQLTLEASEKVLSYMNSLDLFDDVKTMDFEEGIEKGLIEFIDDSMLDNFVNDIKKAQVNPEVAKTTPLKVVYTPLNGTGNKPVRKVLDSIGIKNVTVVKEQENPDGTFKTCPFPNPEIKEALKLALDLANEVKPDLVLATDPDADRVGIAVNNGSEFVLMSGNEVGALLTDYLFKVKKEQGTLPENPVLIETIVSTDLAAQIAKEYGATVIKVLTGFKFIGEQMNILEEKGEDNRYILGFEESYGYLSGTHARDKDAVVASMLICEMAAYYKSKGQTLLQVMAGLYEKYGRYLHTQVSFTCEGITGMQRMKEIMTDLQENPPKEVAGEKVTYISNYIKSKTTYADGKEEEITLPKSDVLSYALDDGSTFIIRPSGTEPKIKVYINVKKENLEKSMEMEEKIKSAVTALMGF